MKERKKDIKFLNKRRTYAKEYYPKHVRPVFVRSLYNRLKHCPTDNPVTVDELMDLYLTQNGCCALSGIKMTWASGKGVQPTSISIDRINNDKGYEVGNVRLICFTINAFRGRMNDSEMLDMARKMLDHTTILDDGH